MLLFDNGDLIQGNPLGDFKAKVEPLKEGEVHPVFKAMDVLDYDAATEGRSSRLILAVSFFFYFNNCNKAFLTFKIKKVKISLMKSQRIPEHKLNFTNTIDQALENIKNNDSNSVIATEKTQTTKAKQVNSNEAK